MRGMTIHYIPTPANFIGSRENAFSYHTNPSPGRLCAKSASLPPEGRLDFRSCEADVAEWAEIQMAEAEELKWQMLEKEEAGGPRMPDTIFFLHIARAGGRTYHQW